VARDGSLTDRDSIDSASGKLGPPPSNKGQGLVGDIEELAEAIRRYLWTTLTVLKGDPHVLARRRKQGNSSKISERRCHAELRLQRITYTRTQTLPDCLPSLVTTMMQPLWKPAQPQSEQRPVDSIGFVLPLPATLSGKAIFSESYSGQHLILLGMKVVSTDSKAFAA
jgi:hypothetical protein